ncbi:MAG TPA: hypothetical protein PK668_06550 [Myxococcota bacterium]|nr:hypothetical protein [Myxococcota bacterium]HRY92497.1 hypothetical protein [Myxococcota bacterium]HSA22827.1 hypothetical protein [Myxococcota bacterium]
MEPRPNGQADWESQATSIRVVLADLVRLGGLLQETGSQFPGPLVTLHLRSGQRLTGRPLDLREVPREGTFLALGVDGPRMPARDISFVELGGIEALTVHDLKALSAVREHLQRGDPLSGLELTRALVTLSGHLRELLGKQVSAEVEPAPKADEAALAAWRGLALRALERTMAELVELVPDEAAQADVAAKLDRLVVCRLEDAPLELRERALRLDPDRLADLPDAELRAALNRAL